MFITFEGLDSSGKSTQVEMLTNYLKQSTKKIIQTKESGGLSETESLRSLILSDSTSDLTKTLLLLADRKEHVDKCIKPALEDDNIVICDRYADSTNAYQVAGSKMNKSIITQFELSANIPKPDLTIYISITPEESIRRLSIKQKDCFESKPLDFMQRVYNYYETLASMNSNRIYKVDGTKSINDIHKLIIRKVGELIAFNEGRRIDDLDGSIKPLVSGREEHKVNRVLIPGINM